MHLFMALTEKPSEENQGWNKILWLLTNVVARGSDYSVLGKTTLPTLLMGIGLHESGCLCPPPIALNILTVLG